MRTKLTALDNRLSEEEAKRPDGAPADPAGD